MSHATTTPAPTPAAAIGVEEPARPALWVLAVHLVGFTLVQAVAQAVIAVLPVIAHKQFEASEWQSAMITAPPTILLALSIFWNDLFNRAGGVKCFLAFWVVACLPLAAMAWARDYWWLLVPHLIACAGGAGWPLLSGALLKSLYAPSHRGRSYGIVWGGSMVVSAVLGTAIGRLLTLDAESFRWFLPMAVGLQLIGVGTLLTLAKVTGHLTGLAPARDVMSVAWSIRRSLDPVLHMTATLKTDPIFARYEGAYMTYGVGWMIGYALLPLIAERKLGLGYDAWMRSTYVTYIAALVCSLLPAAWLLDRLGAVRSTGISFLMLALYPVGLALARDKTELMIVSAYYGVAHAGANMGWMLGPVSLAPSPDRVSTYVAIHATLVGVRGAVFQFLGVGIYVLCARVLHLGDGLSFGIPLALAAGAYVWSAWQMRSLRLRMETGAGAGVGVRPDAAATR